MSIGVSAFPVPHRSVPRNGNASQNRLFQFHLSIQRLVNMISGNLKLDCSAFPFPGMGNGIAFPVLKNGNGIAFRVPKNGERECVLVPGTGTGTRHMST